MAKKKPPPAPALDELEWLDEEPTLIIEPHDLHNWVFMPEHRRAIKNFFLGAPLRKKNAGVA